MRRLDKNARTIAGVGLATARAPVVEIEEHLEGLADNVVRFLAFDIDDETDAAGFMLELRVVQALLWRRTRLRGLAPVLFSVCSSSGHHQQNRISALTCLKFR